MAWTRWLVRANRQVQGTKVDAHLDAFAKLKGQTRTSVEPELPPGGRQLAELFMELHSTRQVGMAPCAITFQEIKAFTELMDVQLEPWEVDCIKVMDMTLLEELGEVEKKQ